jgi:hypothetical protein
MSVLICARNNKHDGLKALEAQRSIKIHNGSGKVKLAFIVKLWFDILKSRCNMCC